MAAHISAQEIGKSGIDMSFSREQSHSWLPGMHDAVSSSQSRRSGCI